MAHITSFFGDKDNKVETEYTGNPELKALIKRMEKLEFTNHAMWIMLEKKGFTNEEFDQAMAEAYEIGKRKDFHLSGIHCPACGQNAQLSDHFKIKCIYCGEEAIMHPYEIYNMLPDKDTVTEPAPTAGETFLSEENKAKEEPYDITKDLNFDDL